MEGGGLGKAGKSQGGKGQGEEESGEGQAAHGVRIMQGGAAELVRD